MQKDELRLVIMAILGGYLAYIGIKLAAGHTPGRSPLYLAAGIFFALFGAAAVVFYIRRIISRRKSAGQAGEEPEGSAEEEQDSEL